MNRQTKAPSTNTDARKGTTHARRTVFGMACLCVLGLAAFAGSGATSAGADTACPNEAIRVSQNATQVGDCRAFERVTPVDKGGGDIVAEGGLTTGAADGNAAAFESRMGFADSEGSGAVGRITYLANRGASGWTTHAITPRPDPDALLVFNAGTHLSVFSDDLSRALTKGYDLPGVTDDTPNRMNFYLEDTATRGLQAVTSSQTGEGGDPLKYPYNNFQNETIWGSTPDLSHVSFVTDGQMVPAIPGQYPNGSRNAYTWDEGTIHLAGILPNGTVPPGGSTIEPDNYKGSMSADGSRLAFSAGQQVYLRIDHSRTVRVTESENPAFTEEPQNVYFEGMTPDGHNLFFTTESPLLAADTAPGPDMYRWTYGLDPEHEPTNLTLITNTGSAANYPPNFSYPGALIGMSDDGSRVYVYEGGRISAWNEGVTKPVASPGQSIGGTEQRFPSIDGYGPGYARVSSDGNWLAYVSYPGGVDWPNPPALFLYSLAADTSTCASCPGRLVEGNGASNEPAFTPFLTTSGAAFNPGFRPRYLSSDGKVFFTTQASLLTQDTNGVADVYSHDGPTGTLTLVSPGKGNAPSEFVDASKNGDDVFFVTRARLVPTDTDEFVDLYDGRIGGGFDEPGPSPVGPCSGETCQGGPAAAPGGLSIASGAATRGNLKQPRHPRCGENQRRVKRHGKVRCARRKQQAGHVKHRKRQTPANRGGLR